MPVLFEAPSQAPKKTSKKGRQAVYPFSTPFTAYVMNPKDIRFETQGTDEEVILFLRQHIIVLIPPFILGIIFFFMPFILFPMLVRFLQSPIEIPSGYVVVGTIFWYVATFGYLLTTFLHWHFNIFIVTNHRIIDIDFLFLLYRKFAEAKIEKIQDISFRTGGIMATVFDYGDVLIQTASELPNFVFEKVPRPSEVVHVISDLTENRKKGRNV
ncbi:MAG: hypothetical protein UV63_C0019G0012 [Microgenomates group bacterium GW2011_GWC1_43_11]|uniref:DUF304 domain-containing protein n=2 Tax=Candidatus Gottesmaniibacteriota TaxID=1752720 RepID=A0A0G1LMY8_9BACT|nr:MAG: hypothetical protein UV63_C0019G0012 [Microgenomates group bacterium GW2011_GWC1_43_11]KKT38892.1 MAG: hypothetical protein UW22_C0004G0022 [Candidatus Gottesmanbacteria bacterium GW2011_GWB1_44_11c]KKT61254.1 MAG: hypothetical protein UW52_C0007G0021 [Candidatus Gottesmanbacteria bacterium GW2011_GWA1_44_24b]HCM82474.1 hypothetical protein [Patescibacteria group bacterium]